MTKPTLSNKVFTENPLLDEIVYNARQLATGVVLKDEDKANNAETVDSIHMGDILFPKEDLTTGRTVHAAYHIQQSTFTGTGGA